MPRYDYYCESCEKQYEISHSYKEVVEICILEGCESKIKKLMPNVRIQKKKDFSPKVGSVVNESIEQFKEDLQREKEKLQKDRK